MSGASFTIAIDNAPIVAALTRVREAGLDLRTLMESLGDEGIVLAQERFEAKAGPDGRAWAPYARSTLRRMPARRKPPQMLRDSNRLYTSIAAEAEDRLVRIGSNAKYAAIHQFGGDIKQPARQGRATFRMADEGAGKGKDGKRVGSRWRFARANDRRATHSTVFDVGAHTIVMPARPYLGFGPEAEARITATIEAYLQDVGGLA